MHIFSACRSTLLLNVRMYSHRHRCVPPIQLFLTQVPDVDTDASAPDVNETVPSGETNYPASRAVTASACRALIVNVFRVEVQSYPSDVFLLETSGRCMVARVRRCRATLLVLLIDAVCCVQTIDFTPVQAVTFRPGT